MSLQESVEVSNRSKMLLMSVWLLVQLLELYTFCSGNLEPSWRCRESGDAQPRQQGGMLLAKYTQWLKTRANVSGASKWECETES